MIENDQFAKINYEPIQRSVCKLKCNITTGKYSKLYQTGSNPGKFYGADKIHKLSYDETIDQVLLRPIVSNIGTASYHISKYLVKLLPPRSHSKYTVKNSK